MLQSDAVVSLLLGGLGAMLGLALARCASRTGRATDGWLLACALAAGVGAAVAPPAGQALGLDDALAGRLELKPVWRLALEKELQAVVRHPRLVQTTHGMNLAAVQGHMAGLTRAGLGRLPAPDLRTWARLRLRIAESSPKVCAQMWNGQPRVEALAEVLGRLSADEQRAWARVTAQAAWLELEQAAPAQTAPDVSLEFGLQWILDQAAVPDAELLRQRLQQGDLGNSRACAAIKVVLRGAERLEPGLRESVLRALAAS